MRIISFLFVVFFIVSGCKDSGSYDGTDEFPVFIIIGQSNAASRATYSGYVRNDNLMVLDESGEWDQGPSPNLNKNSTIKKDTSYQGYNFGYSFAKEYGGKIGIICNARGGMEIEYFNSGGGYIETAKRIEPFKDRIKGFLIHQGERDEYLGTQDEWVDSVTMMVEKYRDLVGWDVPFIFGQVGTSADSSLINKDISSLVNYVILSGVVSSDNLTLEYAGHYDKNGQMELGVRYYQKYVRIMKGSRG